MKIGIIGAGAIGQALATQFVRAGLKTVISNSRGPASLADLVKKLGPDASAGTVQEAADADLVVLAVPWQQLEAVAAAVTAWQDRLVIDATNPILQPGFRMAELGGLASSEVVVKTLPGARVVKAFNTLLASVLASEAQQAGGQRVMFLSGDDAGAKSQVAQLIGKLGFFGIDLGSLALGGKLQQFPGGPLPTLNLIRLP